MAFASIYMYVSISSLLGGETLIHGLSHSLSLCLPTCVSVSLPLPVCVSGWMGWGGLVAVTDRRMDQSISVHLFEN